MTESNAWLSAGTDSILNSLSDGVYITGRDRTILFWNDAAEKLTGWKRSEVCGRSCFDKILAHEDKSGLSLCGEDNCPLHRAIASGQSSRCPVIVFGHTSEGSLIPLQVSVAPIRDDKGNILGGIEVFRDLSAMMKDLETATLIQRQSMTRELPIDERIIFAAHNEPYDIVGGDFFRVERLDENSFVIFIADVMGHGVASALYSMQLHSLWENNRSILGHTARVLQNMNKQLSVLTGENEYFATALHGVLDVDRRALQFCCAGQSGPLILRNGESFFTETSGIPLGFLPDAEYEVHNIPINKGDRILFYTDGATEYLGNEGEKYDSSIFESLAMETRDLPPAATLPTIRNGLLSRTGRIQLSDDLTLIAADLL
jgi:PAS domain S-box-containing protein